MFEGEQVELRAVAHPLRLRLLSMLTAEELSASEAARRLGESAANVSFHLRKLHEAGLVTLVETRRIRGGTAKVYRHVPESGELLRSGIGFAALAQGMAHELTRRALLLPADEAPVFTDFEGTVDEGTATRVRALARELGETLAAGALPEGTAGVRLAVSLAVFPIDGE